MNIFLTNNATVDSKFLLERYRYLEHFLGVCLPTILRNAQQAGGAFTV